MLNSFHMALLNLSEKYIAERVLLLVWGVCSHVYA